MTLGDALVLLGIATTWLLYQLERAASDGRDLDVARKVLLATRHAMPWGELYFGEGYDEEAAKKRAQQDYEWINDANYGEIFHVPTEPLAALLANPAVGGSIHRKTVEAASVALWQIGVFNQLVRQKTDFNARHLAEFVDGALPQKRRQVLADAAFAQSYMLHAEGVGSVAWYATLKEELETNIKALDRLRSRRWWTRWPLALAAVFVAGALVAVTWTAVDRVRTRSRSRSQRVRR